MYYDDDDNEPPIIQPGLTLFALIKAGALIILCGIAALAIMATICM